MTALISIWRQHAKGMEFGEFLAKCVEQSPNGADCKGQEFYYALSAASHSDLVRWARERFGLEE